MKEDKETEKIVQAWRWRAYVSHYICKTRHPRQRKNGDITLAKMQVFHLSYEINVTIAFEPEMFKFRPESGQS